MDMKTAIRDFCKISRFAFARFLRQAQILILKIPNVFLRLKFSHFLSLNKSEKLSKLSISGIKERITYLVEKTRVMTLAVSKNDIPWSSPVYFVFYNEKFYFFSNKNAKHIQQAALLKSVSASVFHDSDNMDEIFGLQMSGILEKVTSPGRYSIIVRHYLKKFEFLKNISGGRTDIIDNGSFFKEKFKSSLYCFHPNSIILSDKAGKTRTKVKFFYKDL